MLKFRLIARRKDRLAHLVDEAESNIDTSCMDEMSIAQFREILDESPTDEMEVIPADRVD